LSEGGLCDCEEENDAKRFHAVSIVTCVAALNTVATNDGFEGTDGGGRSSTRGPHPQNRDNTSTGAARTIAIVERRVLLDRGDDARVARVLTFEA
jgi:hypothetical protein